MDMNKEQERIEEMKQKMPLVVNMVDMIKAGNKITEDDFTSAYGQLITAHPELAKESLEKMVGTFFEVLNKGKTSSLALIVLRYFTPVAGTFHVYAVHQCPYTKK